MPTVLQLAFKDAEELYRAYVPLFSEGGLFVPTTQPCRLRDEVYLMVTLPGDPVRYPVKGSVGWINPGRVGGGRRQGMAVRFPADERAQQLRHRIEALIGPLVGSARHTETV